MKTNFQIKKAHSGNSAEDINKAKALFIENVEKGKFSNSENVGIQFSDINSQIKAEYFDMEDYSKIGEEIIEVELTFDVHFNDSENSNNKGFSKTEQECKDYIQVHNGTNYSYFEDYKGGIVSVVCNETGETVYEEEVR